MRKTAFIFLLTFASLLVWQCRPDRNYIRDRDALLEFSVDTVYFDTIFTTIGTATKSMRVYNPHDRFINISQIALAGGEASVFRINVDGIQGTEFEDFEIAPNDSLYIFVEATLDPNNNNDILRIQDSLVFAVNGEVQDVDLVAWGFDVHMLRDSILDYSTTWTADKPYLIIGGILVDTSQTLTMEPGVEIYMHRDASIFVLGTLEMQGSAEAPIIVQGDRLEPEYQDDPGYPGQWTGIWFFPPSRDNVINHTKLLNGIFGLRADSAVTYEEPIITVENSEISRMSYAGIWGRGSTIEATNLVIGECGSSCVELLLEGSYSFTHCTFANYWPTFYANRKTPAVLARNYLLFADAAGNVDTLVRDIQKAEFLNCIIYGNKSNEFLMDKHRDGALNFLIEGSLARLDVSEYDYTGDPRFEDLVLNKDPKFDSIGFSYELDSLSPAIDKALFDYAVLVPLDKNGNSRLGDGLPDIGAYERIEE